LKRMGCGLVGEDIGKICNFWHNVYENT